MIEEGAALDAVRMDRDVRGVPVVEAEPVVDGVWPSALTGSGRPKRALKKRSRFATWARVHAVTP